MPPKNLKIDQLDLDVSNPRISKAAGQREALQRIIDDQDFKLANLAESIAAEGLNPMDRLLVMKSEWRPGAFTVLEGNRRTAALKILRSPAVLTGLEMRPALQKRLEKAAQTFEPRSVEPIPCFEVNKRAEGSTWIEQRHSGENEGRGIVSWSGVAGSRFRGSDPALQALDFVRQNAQLTDEQIEQIEGRFPITTLDRLLSTPSVRSRIGFSIREDKLLTALPADEAIKPLRKIVLDLAAKEINVSNLKSKDQQVAYIARFARADMPDLKKNTDTVRAVEAISQSEFRDRTAPLKRSGRTQPARPAIVPKTCKLNVTNAKISEIYEELRKLPLKKHPHAIAVLLRVFLETSIDHYMTVVSSPPLSLTVPTNGGGEVDKKLKVKIEESVQALIAGGVHRRTFDGVLRGISNKNSPLSVDLLHSYVHNLFVSPVERDLTAAWDSAQPLFEKVWP